MESVVVQVAEALASIAYVGPRDTVAVVQRAYQWRKALDTIAESQVIGRMHVVVVPVNWIEDDEDRSTDTDKVSCALAFVCKPGDPDSVEQIDEIMATYQVNVNRLRDLSGEDLAGLGAQWVDAKPQGMIDLDLLKEHALVLAWASVDVWVNRSRCDA